MPQTVAEEGRMTEIEMLADYLDLAAEHDRYRKALEWIKERENHTDCDHGDCVLCKVNEALYESSN